MWATRPLKFQISATRSIHSPMEGADRVESRFRFGILDAYDESGQVSSPLFEPCRTNLALALSDGKLPQLR
jgi:hypothetical protein